MMTVADVIERLVSVEGVRVSSFDGSVYGPADAQVEIVIRSSRALSYLATAPGELGLVRAYVAGDLEVEGDIYTALEVLSKAVVKPTTWWERINLARELGGLRLLSRPPIPPQEAKLRGPLHSPVRDKAAIAHHYDLSNSFYEWLLGPSMAYTCAVFPEKQSSLEKAQWTKHDLVARKLGLKKGMRLLDVGCGWGGMTMHAARHYGVRALGVTLSARQAEWAQKKIISEGLEDLAEVRHGDYRDVVESNFDAISSIGLTEHIGEAQLTNYFRFLYDKLTVSGRLLNHCITRPNNLHRARAGAFIGRYVFPDGELVGPGRLMSLMHDTGFEVRHDENIREHYARTLTMWSENLDANWERSVTEIGLARARVWRLYLAASRFGFERNNIQLHQMLGVKTSQTGDANMPLRPDWEPPNED